MIFNIGKTCREYIAKKMLLIFIVNETHFIYCKDRFLLFQRVVGSLVSARGAAMRGKENSPFVTREKYCGVRRGQGI